MPAKTEKQRKFMGAELQRKREGKKTRTCMSENELGKMASKGGRKKDKDEFRPERARTGTQRQGCGPGRQQ